MRKSAHNTLVLLFVIGILGVWIFFADRITLDSYKLALKKRRKNVKKGNLPEVFNMFLQVCHSGILFYPV